MNSTTAASSTWCSPRYAGRPGGKENQRGAQPFAASGDDVFRDLTDEDHVGFRPAPIIAIDGEHSRRR